MRSCAEAFKRTLEQDQLDIVARFTCTPSAGGRNTPEAWSVSTARERWARTIAALKFSGFDRGDTVAVLLLARQALDIVPDDPHLKRLWLDVSVPAVITTDVVGADVALAGYRTRTTWFPLGRTPLTGVRVPRNLFRLRISKAGFQPIESSGSPPGQRYRLDPVDAVPPGMVHVVEGPGPDRFASFGELDDYWIDRFEVTNRQFKEFVDQGGYGPRDYWRELFLDAADPCPGERPSGDFVTTQDSLVPRRGSLAPIPRVKPIFLSEV